MHLIARLLLASLVAPLLGVALIRFIPRNRPDLIRWTALASVLASLGLCGTVVWLCLDDQAHTPSTVVNGAYVNSQLALPWLVAQPLPGERVAPGLDIQFSIGLDGLGLWLYGLSGLLMLTSVLVSWKAVEDRVAGFYSLLLILATGMLGVFVARDVILFYVFFEATLIPLFFLIGIWGGSERRWAAVKFFVYTLAGSLLTFLGLLAIIIIHYQRTGAVTFDIATLSAAMQQNPLDPTTQMWIFLALFAGFAIKVPLFPFHTWLPLAHVEAPTAGSILLAGVLLKIGTYGFTRFNIAMLPDASAAAMPYILGLATVGIIYGALTALAQSDVKKLIAYSSVSHLGFCMLGLFSLNQPGLQGSLLIMISHGLSTGGMFACIGMLYERYHTREIAKFGGLAARFPILFVFVLLFTFASVGLPSTSGFAGEFLALLGMFQRAFGESAARDGWLGVFAIVSMGGIVLGAWYMLLLVRSMFYGPVKEPSHGATATAGHAHDAHDHHGEIEDLSPREVIALLPLIAFIFWIGLHPQFFTAPATPALKTALAAARNASMKKPVEVAYDASTLLEPAGGFDAARAAREASGETTAPATGEATPPAPSPPAPAAPAATSTPVAPPAGGPSEPAATPAAPR